MEQPVFEPEQNSQKNPVSSLRNRGGGNKGEKQRKKDRGERVELEDHKDRRASLNIAVGRIRTILS